MLHFIHEGMRFYHWDFKPSFLSFFYPITLAYVTSQVSRPPLGHYIMHYVLIALTWAIFEIWDLKESILIVMDQELWYDPTLWHSHLREFLSYIQPFCLIHRIRAYLSWLGSWFSRWPLDRGISLLVDDGFLDYSHSSEMIKFSFHIGVWDMIGWFDLMYLYGSIVFSLVLTNFLDDWIRTQTLVRACSEL